MLPYLVLLVCWGYVVFIVAPQYVVFPIWIIILLGTLWSTLYFLSANLIEKIRESGEKTT